MRTSIKFCSIKWTVMILALVSGTHVVGQSAADQSFKAIPQQAKDNGENKAVAKTNSITNKAADKLDSAGTRAFKGFTGLFKKKGNSKTRKPATDSTGIHPPDTTGSHPKTVSHAGGRPSPDPGLRQSIGLSADPMPVQERLKEMHLRPYIRLCYSCNRPADHKIQSTIASNRS
ncbi:MAG: hypothetical protein P4L51_17720 [Puia sp.]|nr:hypothetical protein [Puia sp.]